MYLGHVRSGFTGRQLDMLRSKLEGIERAASAHREVPKLNAKVVWVEPLLVCKVKFAEITPNGKVRMRYS